MAISHFLALSSLALISLCSCASVHGKADLGDVEEINYLVDHTATVISAKYGNTYLLEGNILARYHDFDIAHTHTRVVKEGHLEMTPGSYDTFEVRDRTGRVRSTLQLTPKNQGELLRFRVNDRNYFISSDSPSGSIRISLPSHHVATQHVTPY